MVCGRNSEEIGPTVDVLATGSVKLTVTLLLFESVHVATMVAALVPVGVPETTPPPTPVVILNPAQGVPV